ncbi:MAG: hypothetical protein KA035_02710 [Candidatus Levybacteria bacterium]|nr:hypothetical protein [Candidatus Levybacteria bacterium]
MNYRGVIIEESLGDKSILDEINIIETKTEEVTEKHKTPWTTQWTLHTVEIPEEKSEEIAQKISESLDSSHKNSWYADFNNEKVHYVVFPNKIFKIKLGDVTAYKHAKNYGTTLGIPFYQLQFEELVRKFN